MKFFGWMQIKLNGKPGSSKSNAVSSTYHMKQEPREEFSDWPNGLLAIGTFGNNDFKENHQSQTIIQQEPSDIRDQEPSSSDDLQEFKIEEVRQLQKELTKLLSRKPNFDSKKEVASLPLDSDSGIDLRKTSINHHVILGRCKDICGEDNKKSHCFWGNASQEDLQSKPESSTSTRNTWRTSNHPKSKRIQMIQERKSKMEICSRDINGLLEEGIKSMWWIKLITGQRRKGLQAMFSEISAMEDIYISTGTARIQFFFFKFTLSSKFIFFLPFVLLLVSIGEALVHEYNGVKFVSKAMHSSSMAAAKAFTLLCLTPKFWADAAVDLRGSYEGSLLFSGEPSQIRRFREGTFCRPKESANFSTKPIQAVLFEVEDRGRLGVQLMGVKSCLLHDLAKLGFCLEGEVIYRPSTATPNWPKVFGVALRKMMRGRLYGKILPAIYPAEWCRDELLHVHVACFRDPWNLLVLAICKILERCTSFAELYNISDNAGMLEMALFTDYYFDGFHGLRCREADPRRAYLKGNHAWITFFPASEVLELVENAGAVSDLSGKERLLVLPVAILDAFFIL
ncbi:putative polygalacturonase [Hibiscus syriacus]|uniref:Polygalacturonase n=1 Tax=Hibiscus syriacus TaxID=106335 RepID=A0A6A2YG33_HIBSY|nr:putative polygalacturonase [Hibiscus syriacus]